jgi:hypothetical protein
LQLCNPRDLGSSASCRSCTRIYELTPFASKQYIVQVVTKIAIHVASIVEPRRTLEFTRFFHSLATPPLSSVDGTALRTGKSTKYSIHRSGHTKKPEEALLQHDWIALLIQPPHSPPWIWPRNQVVYCRLSVLSVAIASHLRVHHSASTELQKMLASIFAFEILYF